MPIELLLKLTLWGCWTTTYVLVIRRAHIDKVPAMPFPATCMNTAWEGMMLFEHGFGGLGWITVFIWFALDLVILAQYFVYARPRRITTIADEAFWPASLLLMTACMAMPLVIHASFDDRSGLIAAYLQNALMSILFCDMLLRRNSVRGQSLYIALAKMCGTGVAILYGEPSGAFLLSCYLTIVVFDAAYVLLLGRVARRDGIALSGRL
ncbi:MAG: hypothetical protein U1F36_22325 [Planctomycetota bacterium]